MDTGRFDAWTRRRVGLGISGIAAGLLGAAGGGESMAKKKKKKRGSSNPCAGKNWCLDRTHTCNGGANQCFVTAFGGNFCSAVSLGVTSCAQCSNGEVCVLANGGGDHCGNLSGFDFKCAVP